MKHQKTCAASKKADRLKAIETANERSGQTPDDRARKVEAEMDGDACTAGVPQGMATQSGVAMEIFRAIPVQVPICKQMIAQRGRAV
jgi:hypothetical protein